MNLHNPQDDERFAARLQGFDEAIARGATVRSSATDDTLDTELRQRLDRAQRCLLLLESLRRTHDGAVRSNALDESLSGRLAGPADDEFEAGEFPTQVSVDRFAVVRELGRGGYGVVFLAVDPTLNRLVALKLPRPETLISASLKQRFLGEARAAAGLNHPNIVAIHDLGQAGPVCWIAAEYCPGGTLADWLAEHADPITPREAAHLVAALADAVQHAHQRGVWHRDLKPSNVLLVATDDAAARDGGVQVGGERLTPKLTDFGLAKVLDADSSQTKTGAALGTPSYMPPEQAEHRGDEISPASDVYGLGAILYELLTGRPPFRGATTADTLRKVLLDEPIPPRQLRARLPADLEAICLKCLEKRPERRYAAAFQLAADLRRFLAGEPTMARPPGPWERAAKWTRRRPVAALLLATMLVGAAAVAAGVTLHVRRLGDELETNRQLREAAEAREARLRHAGYVSDMRLVSQAVTAGNLAHALILLERHRPVDETPDERNFAWSYFWNQCHQQLATLTGHAGPVSAVVLTSDGKRAVSAGHDSTLRVFDVESGREEAVLRGHQGNVNGLALSPDGSWLVSGADDGKLMFWSLQPARRIVEIPAHAGDVLCVAVSHDGRRVASGGVDRKVRLWKAPEGTPDGELIGHSDWVRGLAFSPRGDVLASAAHDATVRIWNLNERKLVTTALGGDEAWLTVDFSPDGGLLAAGGLDDLAHLVDTRTWMQRGRIRPNNGWVRAVRFSPEGRRLAVVGNEGRVELWNIESPRSPELAARTSGHTNSVWSAAFSADRQRFATASSDGTVKVWEVSDHVKCKKLAELDDNPRYVTLSLDGSLAAITHGRTVTLCEMRGGRVLESFAHPSRLRAAAITRDGEIVAGGDDAFLGVWRRGGSGPARVIAGQTGIVTGIAAHPSQPMFASSASDGTIRFWSSPDCALEATLAIPGRDLGDLQFSADGKWLVVEDFTQKSVLLCDVESRQVARELAGATAPLVLTADGRVWTGLRQGGLRRWDIATGEGDLTLLGAREPLTGAALSPDGAILAGAVSSGKEVVLWDLASGEVIANLTGHYPVTRSHVVFSSDGQRLFWLGQRRAGIGELLEFTGTRP